MCGAACVQCLHRPQAPPWHRCTAAPPPPPLPPGACCPAPCPWLAAAVPPFDARPAPPRAPAETCSTDYRGVAYCSNDSLADGTASPKAFGYPQAVPNCWADSYGQGIRERRRRRAALRPALSACVLAPTGHAAHSACAPPSAAAAAICPAAGQPSRRGLGGWPMCACLIPRSHNARHRRLEGHHLSLLPGPY
jgi:hypothetical protein